MENVRYGIISLEKCNLTNETLKKIFPLVLDINKRYSIRKLNLNSNSLTSIPDSIGNLENLRHISIENNKLEKLPDSIRNLKNLWTLIVITGNNLNKSEIIKIPEETIIEFDNGKGVTAQEYINQLNLLESLKLEPTEEIYEDEPTEEIYEDEPTEEIEEGDQV